MQPAGDIDHIRKYRRHESDTKPKEATLADDNSSLLAEEMKEELNNLLKLDLSSVLEKLQYSEYKTYFINELIKHYINTGNITDACQLAREKAQDEDRTTTFAQIFLLLAGQNRVDLIIDNLRFVPPNSRSFVLFGAAIASISKNQEITVALFFHLPLSLKESLLRQLLSVAADGAALYSRLITQLVADEKIIDAVYLTTLCSPIDAENLRFQIGITLIETGKTTLLLPVLTSLTTRKQELESLLTYRHRGT
jgi:hypothetical protein